MKQKFYSLDLIRILAATLVIIVHTKGVFLINSLIRRYLLFSG